MKNGSFIRIPKVPLLMLLQYKMDSGTGTEVREQEKHGGGSVSSEIQRRLWVKNTSGARWVNVPAVFRSTLRSG